MLRLTNVVDSETPEKVASDRYVPISVRWALGGYYAYMQQPEPTNDVGCELVLVPETGRIARFVVVDSPPQEDNVGVNESPDVTSVLGLPVFSVEGFKLRAGANSMNFTGEHRTLRFGHHVFFRFTQEAVHRWVVSPPARFGFDSQGILVGVDIDRNALAAGEFALDTAE